MFVIRPIAIGIWYRVDGRRDGFPTTTITTTRRSCSAGRSTHRRCSHPSSFRRCEYRPGGIDTTCQCRWFHRRFVVAIRRTLTTTIGCGSGRNDNGLGNPRFGGGIRDTLLIGSTFKKRTDIGTL